MLFKKEMNKNITTDYIGFIIQYIVLFVFLSTNILLDHQGNNYLHKYSLKNA